ncbi:hypothetical protein KEM54_006936 [Ascosphaera aggregata]|nr:hypothetical protein KEM54_006936 [Ascosphaera aggregata]
MAYSANVNAAGSPQSRQPSSTFNFLRRQRSTDTMSKESFSSRSRSKKASKGVSSGEENVEQHHHHHHHQQQQQQYASKSIANRHSAPKLPDLPRAETLISADESRSEVASIFSAFSTAISPSTQPSDVPPVPPFPDIHPTSPPSSPPATSYSQVTTLDSGDNITNRSRFSYSSVRGGKRVRRRREPTPFNILVVGSKDSGKTSFVRFLRSSFEKSSFSAPPQGHIPNDLTPSAANVGFEPQYIEGKIDGEFMGITIWDSEGLEQNLVDIQLDAIIRFLENKFQDTFNEEMKVIRQPHCRDTHIHCTFLLLDPARLDQNVRAASERAKRAEIKPEALFQSNILDENVDLRTLAAIASRTTVVPIISKADTVTTKHMAQLKKSVAESLKIAGLDPLEQLVDDTGDDDDQESRKAENQDDDEPPILPMSIISPDDDTLHPLFTNPVGRYFPWGFADPYNQQHCDFQRLKEAVFEDWMADMRIISRDIWYEKWRTNKLDSTRRSRIDV